MEPAEEASTADMPLTLASVMIAKIGSTVMAPVQQAARQYAALRIQAVARGVSVRRETIRRVRRRRLRVLCYGVERRCATVVQERWRARALRNDAVQRWEPRMRTSRTTAAAQRIQTAWRCHVRVQSLSRCVREELPRLNWASGSQHEQVPNAAKETEEPNHITETECSEGVTAKFSSAKSLNGLVHKEVGFRRWGPWQMVSWRLRYAFMTPYALCYQHVRAGAALRTRSMQSSRDTSKPSTCQYVLAAATPKAIPFDAIRRIGVARDDRHVLVLECLDRDYAFRFASPPQCEEWTAVLCAVTAASELNE